MEIDMIITWCHLEKLNLNLDSVLFMEAQARNNIRKRRGNQQQGT